MRKFIFFKKRWSFYLFVPSPLQDELAAHVDRAAVYHGDGAVCGDRDGGENISETILKNICQTNRVRRAELNSARRTLILAYFKSYALQAFTISSFV